MRAIFFKNFFKFLAKFFLVGLQPSHLIRQWQKFLNRTIMTLIRDFSVLLLWYKSDKLLIPKNVRIIILPPYSPELNPTEKLWQYIEDQTIKNRLYKTLHQFEDVVCGFVKTLTPEIIKSVCGVNYVAL